jgi:putative tryptophan/tyrosine transport system substrate-binding protein
VNSKPPICAIALVIASSIVLSGCSSAGSRNGATNADGTYAGKTVCIDQYTSADLIDNILSGVEQGLAQATAQGLQVNVQNPQGDAGTEQTIAQQFVSDECTVIAAVGTSGAQAHMNTGSTIPLVFMASSTPQQSGLVTSLDHPGGRATGTSDVFDVKRDIDAMRLITPQLKSVGLVWKVGDPAGDHLAEEATAYLGTLGIRAVPATITTGADITQAGESLAGKVDAVMVPGDTTTIGAASGLVSVMAESRIPVFGGSSGVVKEGGIVSVGYDYENVGKDSAALILKLLDGADPATTAVVIPAFAGYDVNRGQAEKLGLTIPGDLQILTTY